MKTPKDPRHQTRRLSVSEVYSYLSSQKWPEAVDNANLTSAVLENLDIENYDIKLHNEILYGVRNNLDSLHETIKKNSKDWDINMFYKVDLAILLVSTWELMFTKTPQKVVVDEAVELAKEFGEAESPKFVNGVLAGVINSI